MNAAKKNRVSFEDMPDMMAELLDEVRSLGNRVKKLENTCSCRRSDISMREILTAMEVAKMLKVSRVTVYRMAGRGEIPCYRNGSLLMFYKDEILRWVDSTKENK